MVRAPQRRRHAAAAGRLHRQRLYRTAGAGAAGIGAADLAGAVPAGASLPAPHHRLGRLRPAVGAEGAGSAREGGGAAAADRRRVPGANRGQHRAGGQPSDRLHLGHDGRAQGGGAYARRGAARDLCVPRLHRPARPRPQLHRPGVLLDRRHQCEPAAGDVCGRGAGVLAHAQRGRDRAGHRAREGDAAVAVAGADSRHPRRRGCEGLRSFQRAHRRGRAARRIWRGDPARAAHGRA